MLYLELFYWAEGVKLPVGSNAWKDVLWSLPSRLHGARPFLQQLHALSDLLVTPQAAGKPPNGRKKCMDGEGEALVPLFH